jgi:hypothetical protein
MTIFYPPIIICHVSLVHQNTSKYYRLKTPDHTKFMKKKKLKLSNPSNLAVSHTTSFPSPDDRSSSHRVSATTSEPPDPLSHDLPTPLTEIRLEPRPLSGFLPLALLVVFSDQIWSVITSGLVIWGSRHSGSIGDGEQQCGWGRTRVGHVVARLPPGLRRVWLSGSDFWREDAHLSPSISSFHYK